jgi:hypothetical protein
MASTTPFGDARAYLRPDVRAGISLFARSPQRIVTHALDKLRKDLASGAWQARNAELVEVS